jgi:hypothetical protein
LYRFCPHGTAQGTPYAAVAPGSEGAEPWAYSIGTATPGSRVHNILTASRIRRARVDRAVEELRAVAAAGDPSEDSEGVMRRPAVPRIGSAAAGGLRPVSDTVRPVYGAGVVAPDSIPGPSARNTHPGTPPTLGVLSTDESAAKAAQASGSAAAALTAAEPQVVTEETVVIATEEPTAAVKTVEKVQTVVVRPAPGHGLQG